MKVHGENRSAVAAAVAAAREAARAAGEKIGPAVSRAARQANGSLPIPPPVVEEPIVDEPAIEEPVVPGDTEVPVPESEPTTLDLQV